MNEIYVASHHPHYLVMVNGAVYDEFVDRYGYALTLSQKVDVARGYQEALEHYVRSW